MSFEPPQPPSELPDDVIETLESYSPDRLRTLADYADALAEHREREARLDDETDKDDSDQRPEEMPDDVPTRATVTVKEINENRYEYWQWREGDKVRSQYKGPANGDE